MKKNISFLFFLFYFSFIFAGNKNLYLLDSCLANIRFEKDFYQKNESLNENQIWGFDFFYDGLLLGPSVNSFKFERYSESFFEDSLYPQKQSLNRMHLGVATRFKFGYISTGLIKEALVSSLYVFEGFSFSNENGRFGIFLASDFLFQRKSNFFSKTKVNFLLQIFAEESEYLNKISLDSYVSFNVYDVNIGKICLSSILSSGTHGRGFEQIYFYEGGLGISFNKSPSKKMRNNLITFSYQRNSLSYGFQGHEGFFTLKINIDPYYLGIFKDLRN